MIFLINKIQRVCWCNSDFYSLLAAQYVPMTSTFSCQILRCLPHWLRINAHCYSDGVEILVQRRSNINMRPYHLLWNFSAILQSCYFVKSYKTSHPSTNIEMLRTWFDCMKYDRFVDHTCHLNIVKVYKPMYYVLKYTS